MRGLVITAAILAAVIAIGLIRVHLRIIYDSGGDDGFRMKMRVLFYRRSIIPAKEKRLKLKDYTPKKIKKREAKESKAELRKAEKKAKKAAKKEERKKDKEKMRLISSFSDLTELVALICECANILLKKFFGHLYVKVRALRLSIGGDAAQAAIKYGAVCTALENLLTALEGGAKIRYRSDDKVFPAVQTSPGFGEKDFRAKVDVDFSFSVAGALAVIITTFWRFLRSPHNRLLGKLFGKNKKSI